MFFILPFILQGAVGYRRTSDKATVYPAAQLVPFIDVVIPGKDDDTIWGFGAQAVLTLGVQYF